MVMQLIEEKKLTLQTKLNRFYPKMPNAEKISIYDLLHHRTGIVDFVNQDSTFHKVIDKKHSKEDILKVITTYKSNFEPGSKYEYSNSNYFILGCVIEKLTKKSYAENLENRIVKKAELGTYESKTEMTAKGAVTNKVFVPTTYYKEETTGKQSITGNELNCLLDDPVDSILWIGTQRAGINAYNYANDSFITYRHNENNPESLVTDDITKIIAASDGNLWICTYWKGVDYFDKQTGQFTHYNTETVPGFASNHIWSAIDGGNGLLYIGHVDRGFSILSIKDKTVKNFTHEPQETYG